MQRLEVLTAQRGPLIARQQALEDTLVRAPEVDRALSGFDRQLRQLQEENAKLKRMYADLALMHHALKDVVDRKL